MALNTDTFLLGIDEIFKLEPLLHAVSRDKPSYPFVFVILYYSDLSMVYNHDGRDAHDRLKWNNGTRSTPTMARNSGIDVAVLGIGGVQITD